MISRKTLFATLVVAISATTAWIQFPPVLVAPRQQSVLDTSLFSTQFEVDTDIQQSVLDTSLFSTQFEVDTDILDNFLIPGDSNINPARKCGFCMG
ncbi:hypothetical protein ScalyP_jg8883 [Parmales sp. scaly parma]|nr:hypothetical protein ScalyP_jg8883 [Parmales sp. scaly parma]